MAGDRLTAEAVERIISATGLGDAAAGIDRDRLAKDLELYRDLCLQGAAALKPAAAKRDRKSLEQIAVKARKLLADALADGGFLPRKVKSALMALIAATDRALERLSDPARPRDAQGEDIEGAPTYRDVFKNRSASDLLIGFGLRQVYQVHFGLPAKFSRPPLGGEPFGTFIDFAYQALIELKFTRKGKPYARETIAHALQLAKTKKVRNQKD